MNTAGIPRCETCGYDLSGLRPEAGVFVCPECATSNSSGPRIEPLGRGSICFLLLAPVPISAGISLGAGLLFEGKFLSNWLAVMSWLGAMACASLGCLITWSGAAKNHRRLVVLTIIASLLAYYAPYAIALAVFEALSSGLRS